MSTIFTLRTAEDLVPFQVNAPMWHQPDPDNIDEDDAFRLVRSVGMQVTDFEMIDAFTYRVDAAQPVVNLYDPRERSDDIAVDPVELIAPGWTNCPGCSGTGIRPSFGPIEEPCCPGDHQVWRDASGELTGKRS